MYQQQPSIAYDSYYHPKHNSGGGFQPSAAHSQASHHPYPPTTAAAGASGSFLPAPAPTLNDDGDVTVVSALTTTSATRPELAMPVPYQIYAPSAITPPTAPTPPPTATAMPEFATPYVANPYNSASTTTKPELERPTDLPRTISTSSSTSLSNREPKQSVVAAGRLTNRTANQMTSFTSTSMIEAPTRPTTITTMATYDPSLKAGPHRTYPAVVEKLKIQRKRATVACGVTGGLVGLITLGPVGAVVGGAGGSILMRTMGKRKERKLRDEIAMRVIAEQERGAPEVKVHRGTLL